MSSPQLFTIGYQGRTLADFTAALRACQIETVVDVRELPLSRVRGFSKAQLSQALGLAGIGYVSMRTLGSPRHLRRELRRTGDWDEFAHAFRTYLVAQQEAIDLLASRLGDQTMCLLCFEHESRICHRTIVAEELLRSLDGQLSISHL